METLASSSLGVLQVRNSICCSSVVNSDETMTRTTTTRPLCFQPRGLKTNHTLAKVLRFRLRCWNWKRIRPGPSWRRWTAANAATGNQAKCTSVASASCGSRTNPDAQMTLAVDLRPELCEGQGMTASLITVRCRVWPVWFSREVP